MEDPAIQKENANKDRRLIFEIKLKNNSSDNKYIPIHGLWEYQYSSRIGLYVNSIDIAGICVAEELSNSILPSHDSTVIKIRVRGCDLKKAGVSENISLPELLSRIQARYDKDVRDTAYSKYPIADITISPDKNIVIEHKPYEIRKTFLLL